MTSHHTAVASETAQFGLPEIIRGSYGAGISTKLPIHIPLKKVFYIQQSGRNLDGIEADRCGLITKAVPQDQLYDYAYALAKEIASHSHVALQYGKKVVYGVMEPHYEAAPRGYEGMHAEMSQLINPVENLEAYLQSQKRRTGTYQPGAYRRPSRT